MDEKALPKDTVSESAKEIRLKGVTICPGIGIGHIRILDREIYISRKKITSDQVESEQQRYSEAVKTVSDHLYEHIKEAHAGSSLSASLILKNHEAILRDKQFHDAVRRRISAEYKNAMWAIEEEGIEIIGELDEALGANIYNDGEQLVTTRGAANLTGICGMVEAAKSHWERIWGPAHAC